MRIKKDVEIKEFLDVLDKTEGNVWLESDQGDKYNLKSTLSRYVAIAQMIKEEGDQLGLFCDKISDENLFYELFEKYPDML